MSPDLLATVTAALTAAGYTPHPTHPAHQLVDALSHNGPFVVHGAWLSGDGGQWVHVEQNTVNHDDGSAETFPPVLVIENDRGGRVAVNLHDMQALAAVLAGEVTF